MTAPEPGFAALRQVLHDNGVEFETQNVDIGQLTDVVDALALPDGFVALWSQDGPAPGSELPWVVEEVFLFGLEELLVAQEGYRFEGPQGAEPLPWSPDWVVIGSVHADPFFIDVRAAGPPVFWALHGQGSWEPVRVAPTVEDFIACLTAFETVLLRDFDLEVWEEDGLLPDFRLAVRRAVEQTAPAADADGFMAALD